ncbi:hypothetical protein ACS5PJ_16020 [Pseudarthrobacter sp. YS3]|uniref:hypothetical protein n=1 Tax=Pseudarthrobacter sp. YS3 TaxID=3453718 RepID=UPI003EEB7346
MRKILFAFFTAFALVFTVPLAATAVTNTSNTQNYSTLAARWWTWALTQPTSMNPLLDTTGALCANQQSGKTWFLGGLFGTGGSVTRSCTIPANTSVFFPLANYVDCEYATDNVPVKTVRSFSAFVQDGTSNLSVILDGQVLSPSPIQFERSDVFRLSLPDDNVFGVPAAFLDPCADSGYYALLKTCLPGTTSSSSAGPLPSKTTLPQPSPQPIT